MKLPIFNFRFSLFLFALCLCASVVQASDYFIAETTLGSGNGSTAGNADCVTNTYFTTSGNWTPGITWHLVGVITNYWSILGSGTAVSPITIKFESGAGMSAPIWVGNPAINGGAYNNIVIDGGVNGYITATNAGDSPPLSGYGCNGIVFADGGSNNTVQNLSISNLYVHLQNGSSTAGGSAISLGSVSGILVSNCLIHDAAIGVAMTYGASCSNITVVSNNIYNCNWGVQAGDSGSSSLLNGFWITGNKFHDWANWDAGNTYHHNGVYLWAVSGGTLSNVYASYNTVGGGYTIQNTSGLFFSGKAFNVQVFRNVFLATDGTSPDNGLLTLGFNGGFSCATNNDFIGLNGNGKAISFSGESPQPSYFHTNNLIVNMGSAYYVTVAGTATWTADYDAYYGCPNMNGQPGNNTPFTISLDTDEAYVNYSILYAPDGSYWQGDGFDAHGVVCVALPISLTTYIPSPGSPIIGAAYGGGAIGAYEPAGGGPVTPTVVITAPAQGAVSCAGSSVNIVASASVSSGSVTNVSFYTNAVLAGAATASPFSIGTSPLSVGLYNLSAVATAAGISATSAVVTVSAIQCIVIQGAPGGIPIQGVGPGTNGIVIQGVGQ